MTGCVRRGGLAAAAVFVVAGCAGVPDSGPVRVGRPVAAAGGGLADETVREVPAGPQPGATPLQLVSGFLRAMADSDGDSAVARSYLVPGASWAAGSTITLYAEPSRVVRAGRDTVVVHAKRVGVLGSHGVYRVAPGTIRRRFEITRRGREWRIAKLDSGVLLSSDDAGRLLQPAALYFLTPAGDRLVPEPVLEAPQEPGLATTLMRELLAGPGPLLAPGVRTAVPRGTTLVGNVPISADGVADVDLSSGTHQIGTAQLVRLSAQVVWTLRQVSSVRAVRLFANGTPLEAPGVSSLQPVSLWPQFDPAAAPSSRGALLVRAGRVVGLGTAVPAPLRHVGLVAARRSADGSVLAAVRAGGRGHDLLVGRSTGPLRARLRDASLSAPSFGPDNEVIAATATSGVRAVGPTGPARQVELSGRLRSAAIRDLTVSRDATRVALVIATGDGNELDVATVVRSGPRLAFREPRVVLPASSRVSGVAWADADDLVTTVTVPHGRRAVVEVSSDGYRLQELSRAGLPPSVDGVAAAPGQRVLAAGRTGTWELAGRRWRKVSSGTAPSYAGG